MGSLRGDILMSLPVVRLTELESAWKHFIVCGVVQDVPGRVSLLSVPRRG